jgi:hypothetical protein
MFFLQILYPTALPKNNQSTVNQSPNYLYHYLCKIYFCVISTSSIGRNFVHHYYYSMAYYKIIKGSRYDRDLIDAADNFTKGRGEYQISFDEMQTLVGMAGDGLVVTEIERNTLRYIATNYPLTEKAKQWYAEQDPAAAGGSPIQITIQKVLKEKYGLLHLQCKIEDSTVEQYLADSFRKWEAIFTAAIGAYLNGSQGQLSFIARVRERDLQFKTLQDPTPLLKSYLDRGTIYLIPPDTSATNDLPYDLPHVLDAENFWTFVLKTPDFEPIEFFAFVSRGNPTDYSIGKFSRKADIEQTIQSVIRQYTGFEGLKWNIPTDEVKKQIAILPDQNFGNALFSALNTGIFNQESSFSFGDFIRQEVWPDPETPISTEMRAYVNTGTLHLVPLDYRLQTNNGTALFPVPEQFSFWLDGEWIFGLEMPKKTNARFVINTPRDGNDGDTGWINGFLDENLPVEVLLQNVVEKEFKLEGLQLTIDVADYDTQRLQFGRSWQHLPGLVRLAINTMLHDYLTPNSVFNVVAKRHEDDVVATDFDDPKEYRAAIRHLIENYLRKNAVLQLRPINPDENMAENGATMEKNWLFRAVLEDLLDHYFWIIIQRRPDDDERPYNFVF